MPFARKSSEIHLVQPTGRAASHVFQRRRISPATPSRVYPPPLFPTVRPSVRFGSTFVFVSTPSRLTADQCRFSSIRRYQRQYRKGRPGHHGRVLSATASIE